MGARYVVDELSQLSDVAAGAAADGKLLLFDAASGKWQPRTLQYTHSQDIAATVWTINHNMGRKPSGVTVIRSDGAVVVVHLAHPTVNQTVVTFEAANGGKAYLT